MHDVAADPEGLKDLLPIRRGRGTVGSRLRQTPVDGLGQDHAGHRETAGHRGDFQGAADRPPTGLLVPGEHAVLIGAGCEGDADHLVDVAIGQTGQGPRRGGVEVGQ